MRVAPVGIFMSRAAERCGQSIESTFQLGADISAITHGHPTGYLTAGTLALIIAIMLRGATVPEALSCAKRELLRHDGHLETMQAITLAEKLSRSEPNSAAAIQKLGQGWVAEEALAISLYCALCARDFEQGVVLAVNHDGDSDSTGAIAGNLLGCCNGISQIPKRWLEPLELREVIEELADNLVAAPDWDIGEYSSSLEGNFYYHRYPPN